MYKLSHYDAFLRHFFSPANEIFKLIHVFCELVCARLRKLLFPSVSIGYADRPHAEFLPAEDIIFSVPDHNRMRRVYPATFDSIRNDVLLFRSALRKRVSGDKEKIFSYIEMQKYPLRIDVRL